MTEHEMTSITVGYTTFGLVGSGLVGAVGGLIGTLSTQHVYKLIKN
jgi:hypothetical protein